MPCGCKKTLSKTHDQSTTYDIDKHFTCLLILFLFVFNRGFYVKF